MTSRGWPYPSLGDPAWLVPADAEDRYLAAAREAVRALAGAAPGTAPDGATLLAALTGARELAERVDWVLLSLVGEARGAGLSWEQVASALGVSRQAAHKRFAPYVAAALARAGAAD